MNTDQFAGTARYVGGRIEEAAGAVIEDREIEGEGLIDQVKGRVQTLYGDAKDSVKQGYDHLSPAARHAADRVVEVTRQNTLLTVVALGAVGCALGFALKFAGSSAQTRSS